MENDVYLKTGRVFFGISVLAIGVVHIATRNFPAALLPVWASLPGRQALAYVSGIILMIAGILTLTRKYSLHGALISTIIFLCFLLFVHIPQLIINLKKPGEWTPPFEVLMLFGGALTLAGIALNRDQHKINGSKFIAAGKYIFAVGLFMFAVLHYLFPVEVTGFMPLWMPFKLFWAYFVMCAFLAASVSIFINKQVRLSETLVALMFFIWVCILHLPVVIENIHSANNWIFVFVPLAMSGVGLLIAGTTNRVRL
jgi:hypothetical protein